MKRCNSCGIEKEETELNYCNKALGIRHPTCKECQKGFRKNWYEGKAKARHLENVKVRKSRARDEAREFVYQYLATHPCIQCGERDPMVLEFHHRGDKDLPVSVMVAGGYPIHKIQEEINKCDVLCANCHRRLTMSERGWFRGQKR